MSNTLEAQGGGSHLVAMGTVIEPVPDTGLAANFSQVLRDSATTPWDTYRRGINTVSALIS